MNYIVHWVKENFTIYPQKKKLPLLFATRSYQLRLVSFTLSENKDSACLTFLPHHAVSTMN